MPFTLNDLFFKWIRL